MDTMEWEYDPTTSNFHRSVAYIMLGFLGGVGVLQLALVSWLFLRQMPISDQNFLFIIIICSIILLIGILRYRHQFRKLIEINWPLNQYKFGWLLFMSIVSAVILHTVALMTSFNVALILFISVFMLSAFILGLGTSDGKIDSEENRMVVNGLVNGQEVKLSDIETLKMIPLGPAVVIRLIPTDDTDGLVPSFFVVDPETADRIQMIINCTASRRF